MSANTPKYIKTFVISTIVLVLSFWATNVSAADLTVANKSSSSIPNDGITYVYDNANIDGVLTVNGTLIIEGDFNMGNNGELIAGDNSYIIIKGNANLGNKVELSLSSYFLVMGNLTKNGASNQGEVIVDGAKIYVIGIVDVAWNDFTQCNGDYPGETTPTDVNGNDCDAGGFEDFVKNVDPDDLPDGIYDEVVNNNTITDYFANGGAFCQGTDLVLKTYSEAISKVSWYYNGTALEKNTSQLTWTTSQPGEYKAIYKVGNNWYKAIADVASFQTNPLTMP